MNYTKEQVKKILQEELFNKDYNFRYDISQLGNQKLCRDLMKYFNKHYPDLFNCGAEILYCYMYRNNINYLLDKMFCYCGNKNKFKRLNKGYNKYCSKKCSANDKNLIYKRVNTMRMIENGLSGYDRMVLKLNKTKLNNVDKNGLNGYQRGVLKAKETKKQKHGDENYNNREKCALTKLKKYNNSKYNNRKKAKETMINKYNSDSYAKTSYYKNLYKDTLFLLKRELKRAFTCYLKYKTISYLGSKDCLHKSYITKKKNNTFNSSKIENIDYKKLLTKYPDTIHHYKDDRYPFECDFYIPSKDLFIELNFHWTHGSEPFNKDNLKHLEKLNLWKNKNTFYYNNAINTWSNLDVRKLKTFINNNINYKIFYTQKEFNNWFDKI